MFPVSEGSKSEHALVPLTKEGALPPSRGDACADISCKRLNQEAVKGQCDFKRGSSQVEGLSSHISRRSGWRMGWDGMNPHVRIAFEDTKMYMYGITQYVSIIVPKVGRAVDAERKKIQGRAEACPKPTVDAERNKI